MRRTTGLCIVTIVAASVALPQVVSAQANATGNADGTQFTTAARKSINSEPKP